MTPPPVSVCSLSSVLQRLLQPPYSWASEVGCPLPLPGEGELSLLPLTWLLTPLQQSKEGKRNSFVFSCFCLFSLNQHRMDRGDVGGHLSWYVTKEGFPPEPQPFGPGSLGETSTASAQTCKLSNMFAHILSTFSQVLFLLLGRWLAVLSRIQQGSRR